MEGVAYQRWICVVAMFFSAAVGCSLTRNDTEWRPPALALPLPAGPEGLVPDAAEHSYAAAVQLQAEGVPACVDHYYQSAACAWQALERSIALGVSAPQRTTKIYESALAQLLITAQQFGRWDPDCGLTVVTSAGPMVVPAHFDGFVWNPSAFRTLAPCGSYEDANLAHQYRNAGLGISLVAERHVTNPEPFTLPRQAFAATAVLRPSDDRSYFRLEFYDPHRVSATWVAGREVAIARDLSAPYAFAGQNVDRRWIDGFLWPSTPGERDGLSMVEPFQPSKIPVVLVHGLLSDPETWVTMLNELRAKPELDARFQWWEFHYATGEPFLTSAAKMRRQMTQLRQTYDPTRSDPALSKMVVIGHSMGGLVGKLQVTSSGNHLWKAFATRPLASASMPPTSRQLLQEAFYFRPSPDVTRIVYIATPHLGSSWAQRPIGRLGAAMVRPSALRTAQFEQLIYDNPHLLRNESRGRMPTSIDLLEPTNPILEATSVLPYRPGVTLHSIVGVARTTWRGEPSDGVVPVSSARLMGVASERDVDAIHTRMQKDMVSVQEVEHILHLHLRENVCLTSQGSNESIWN